MFPYIAIVTPTKNRHTHLDFQIAQMCSQSYPLDKIIWIITDSSDDTQILDTKGVCSIWKKLPSTTPFGKSRNISIQLALDTKAEYIFFMDDDDIIHKDRFTYTIQQMMANPSFHIAGSSRVRLFYVNDNDLLHTKYLHHNHTVEPYMCVTRDYATNHRFDDSDHFAFLVPFLKDFTEPVLQLDPNSICLMIGHTSNTINKNQMKENPKRFAVDSIIPNTCLEDLMNEMGVPLENCAYFMKPYSQP